MPDLNKHPQRRRIPAGTGAIVIAVASASLVVGGLIALRDPVTPSRYAVGVSAPSSSEAAHANLERGIALLQSVEKTVCEGAGAAGLAAVLQFRERFAGMRVAVPLTGGNIDARMFANVIMRDLIRSGSLMRIEVPISDQPGALATLATVLAEEGANIVDVSHERMSLALNPKRAALDLVVECRDAEHGEMVLASLRRNGFDVAARAAA